MISAVRSLGEGGATEFGSPDKEGVFEEATLFKVLKEGGDGFVDSSSNWSKFFRNAAVIIPVIFVALGAAPNLHESGAAFAESSCKETASTKIFGDWIVGAVGSMDLFWLVREIECFGSGELHLGG